MYSVTSMVAEEGMIPTIVLLHTFFVLPLPLIRPPPPERINKTYYDEFLKSNLFLPCQNFSSSAHCARSIIGWLYIVHKAKMNIQENLMEDNFPT